MPRPPRIVHLDQLEFVPGPGSLTWRPVRSALGIRAFGANAYTAEDPGTDVVEAHTESPQSDHEELYFVASGRATFTIDGETHDAPVGTYVFIPDPASHRYAVAAEAGTTVLTFGGPPTFEPSAWESAFRAAPLMRSDSARAREILEDALREHPDEGALHYNVACLEAIEGNRDAALNALRTAIRLRPEAVDWARTDEDFAGLSAAPEFRTLIDG